MDGLMERLKEPSSYAALAAVLALFGLNVDPGLWGHVVRACVGVAGLVAFLLPERRG
jgi:hypothetical protein